MVSPVPTADSDLNGLPHLYGRVRELVGDHLASYLSGAQSTEEFTSWLVRAGDTTRVYAARRLSLVLELADLFRPRNAVTLLRAWLRTVDPALGRRSPAQVIRGPGGESAVALADAAERFLDERVPRPQGVPAMVRAPLTRRMRGRMGR
jgi:broad specificity phosphatase PhoE